MARRTPSFVRFVVGTDAQHHRGLTGVINEAWVLRDDGRLSGEECDRLEGTYRWFNAQVPVPPFSRRRWPEHVVCWFKSDAGEAITRMWDLVAILREHDVCTRLLRSADPGRIVYEDDLQVVVAQWRRL